MRKFIIAATAALTVAGVGTAFGERVDDPTGVAFSDGTNLGYVEADTEGGAVRACNENGATPGGDSVSGYIWVNPSGESTEPSYGTGVVGAGDADGEGADAGDDCP